MELPQESALWLTPLLFGTHTRRLTHTCDYKRAFHLPVRFCIELFSEQEVARLNHLLIFFLSLTQELARKGTISREIIVTHWGGFFSESVRRARTYFISTLIFGALGKKRTDKQRCCDELRSRGWCHPHSHRRKLIYARLISQKLYIHDTESCTHLAMSDK